MGNRQVVIIGAGPSGLMAAETLAASGHKVTIYDRMPSPGRKLLMAGRGGLNLTHSEPLDAFIARYGEASDWLSAHIQAFSPQMLRQWCEALGQETYVGSSGRVFPRAMKAAPLLRAWLRRLDAAGVKFMLRHSWHGWSDDKLRFTDDKGQPHLVTADATLLALGGASWPRLGADGSWVSILEAADVQVRSLRPSNVGFVVPWSDYFAEKFAGQPLKPVAITHHGVTRQGEAMVTEKGLEGGVIYALSASIREAILANGKANIVLDLRPGMDEESLQKKLDVPRGSKSLSNYLQKGGLSLMAITLLREVIEPEELMDASSRDFAAWFKALPLTLTATAGIERAISTAGGVTHDAVTDGLMLRAKPGIFVAGEMLDWEAPTGGYLLQGCFSTAVAAAAGIQAYLS